MELLVIGCELEKQQPSIIWTLIGLAETINHKHAFTMLCGHDIGVKPSPSLRYLSRFCMDLPNPDYTFRPLDALQTPDLWRRLFSGVSLGEVACPSK